MLAGLFILRKVEDVTTAKDEPAPVYLLDELVKAAQSTPEEAQHIVEYLVKKLESKSPVVKAKALRACKYIAQKGARDALRILQRSAGPIRSNLKFGTVDPLKGDALNERVRSLAQEAVAAIFDADTTAPYSAPTPTQSRIQGFGSQNVAFTGAAPTQGVSRMMGFGSDHLPPSNERGSITPSTPPSLHTDRQKISFLSDDAKMETGDGHGAVHDGGGYGSVLGDEQQLVDSICQPGGVRSAPAREDLRRFIDTAGSLDGGRIAVMLQKKLESPNWLECYRALYAIETVILQGSSVSCGEIGVHFQGDLDIIRRCLKSPQRTVRERAQKIMDIFVEVDDVREPLSSEEVPPLIDGVIEDTPVPPSAPLDLLDNDVAHVEPPQGAEMLSGLEEAPQTGTAPVGDLFSGLALSDSSTPAKGSNVHLAALLAPSPASDPFPEAVTPLKAEPSPLQQQPQQQSVAHPDMAAQYGMPQPPMMGAPFMGQMPGLPPQQPGSMPYMAVPMQSNVAPVGYPQQFVQPYGNYMQPSQPSAFQPQERGNRGEVPLQAFLGPAHVERRSSGKTNSAFSFVGDHISQLRDKK